MVQSEEFRRLLTEGIYRVSVCEGGKPIRVIQDELGYALNKRGGGSAIEYWRQGHLPKTADIAKLARVLVQRSDLDQTWLVQFLASAHYPHPESLCCEFFPQAPAAPDKRPLHVPLPTQLLPNPTYRTLVGRALLLEEALTALQDGEGRWIVAIDGLGGMGKTALAREIVAQCEKKQLFDTVLWVSAAHTSWPSSTLHRTLTLDSLLDTVARYLGAPDLAEADPLEKRMRVQTLLRRQRVLLVLDNLETAAEPQAVLLAQLQTLLNPSKVLCTSRYRFTGDVYALHLGGLDSAAAIPFVRQEGQERRIPLMVTAPTDLIAELVTITGGSPLALKLAVGQASYLPLLVILQMLHTTQPGLGETGLYPVLFGSVWEQLAAPARTLLLALTLFAPGEGSELAVLQAVSNFTMDALFDHIQMLWQLSLLEVVESSQGSEGALRYFLHPLTYHFVTSKLAEFVQPSVQPAVSVPATDPPSQPGGATYLGYITGCRERLLHYLLAQIEQSASLPPSEPTRRLAMHLLNTVLPLPAFWPLTRQLLINLAPRMEQAGHRRDWLPYLEQGLAQSQQMADRAASAELHINAGMLYQLLGEYPTAALHFKEAVVNFAAVADGYNQARALNRLAYVARLQHDLAEATRLAQTALALLRETDAEQGSSYTILGAVALDEGMISQAVADFRQALACWQPTGNLAMIARRLRDLGAALGQQANYPEARDCYEQALRLFAQGQEPSQQAVVRMNLGNIYLRLGQPEQALALYRLAEPVFRKTCDEPQLTLLYHNLAEAQAALPQPKPVKKFLRA